MGCQHDIRAAYLFRTVHLNIFHLSGSLAGPVLHAVLALFIFMIYNISEGGVTVERGNSIEHIEPSTPGTERIGVEGTSIDPFIVRDRAP